MTPEEFTEIRKTIKAHFGISDLILAKKIGVKPRIIYYWMQGRNNIGKYSQQRINRMLKKIEQG